MKMNPMAAMRELSAVRDSLHGPGAPLFMRGVRATGIGPKIVDGAPTATLAIHLLVPQKLAQAALSHSALIPRTLAGYPTDVLDSGRGELAPARQPVFTAPTGWGYGTPLYTESGAWGTVACAAHAADGRPLLVTSAHVVGLDELVYDGSVDPPLRLGRCIRRLPTASRQELYGQRGSALAGQHLVDVAVIEVDPELTPGRSPLAPQLFATAVDTASIDEWLFTSTPLYAWGAASRVWRQGMVVSYWPRRTQDDHYGLCLIQQQPMSEPGDSGSLWLAYVDKEYTTVGLHWGLSTDRQSVMSFVTDGIAALGRLGVRALTRVP
jgi:hypothetical protein